MLYGSKKEKQTHTHTTSLVLVGFFFFRCKGTTSQWRAAVSLEPEEACCHSRFSRSYGMNYFFMFYRVFILCDDEIMKGASIRRD
jgi:hypothetical protein